MSVSQNFNWYQDHNYVTASVKIVQKNLKNYRAEFTKTGFSVYTDGGLLWECKLCGTIVPNKCQLKTGSVRVEVRLKKQDLGQWSDFCGKNDSKVYNPVKILSQSDETASTAVEEEASSPPLSTPKDTNPQSLDDSNSTNSIPDAMPDTQSDKPGSTTVEEETSLPPTSTPEDTNPQSLSMDDSNFANSIPDAMPDTQSDKPGSTTVEEETSLPPTSTLEDTNPQSLPMDDSNYANSISDTTKSIPDTANSIPDTENSIPGSIADTANLVPDIETTNSVPTSGMEPKMEDVTSTRNSVPDATVPHLTLDEDTEFIDFMNQPEPVELMSSSQGRDAAEPRRAAGSFNISGADPIASSDDHAIDSNDVVVPEATKDTELEISHLVHDWVDKIPNPVVEIIVPIRSFDANSLRVRFSVDSFKVIFKTRAEMFLKMIPGATENSYICWRPKLFGKIIPKESKHWVKMPKLYIQVKKAPPYHRWKSLEAPSSPEPSAMEIPPAPRMGVSNPKGGNTTDTPPKNSSSGKATRPTSSTPQNVAKPVDKQKNLSLAGGAGNAVAAVKAGTIVKLVDMSYTGLINIGNTCYMNTIIQSLSNTRELRDYLINGTFTKERNTTNPLGYKGKLVDTFASLLKKLWTGQHEKLSPHSILSLMASKYNQFTERSQHDAHEFMSFLLDGLHEDMNRVIVKPNTAAVEPNNRPDQEVAQEAWEVYRKRNDSFIVDTFQGQFKSTLYCTKCTTVSVTFDPFSCLAVPLPKKMRLMSVVLFRKDPTVTPVKYMFKLPHDSTVELLKASIGKKTGILLTKLRVFEAYKGKIQVATFNNKMSIDRIGDKDMIIVSEVLSEKEAGGEVVEISVLQRILMPFHPTTCAFCKRSGDADNLKRCTNCLAVAYCNRTCQEEHWKKEHRVNCKSQNQPPTVGVPFIVSLPKKKCTYKNLANTAEKFARLTLNVERGDVQSPPSTNGTSTGSVNNNSSEGGASLSSSTSGVSSPTSGSSLHSHIEEVPATEKPDFIFTPVNRFGNTAREGKHLEDIGERLLNLNNVKFLALDWRNNPKIKGYVKVTKKKQFYDEDDSCSTTYTDEIESGPATLQKCLHLFTVPETLSSDEAWYCPKCKEHREAIKQMSLWRLPKILIIQLKRFTYQKCIWKDKIDKDVSFPLKELDMSKYVEEKALNDVSVTSRPPVYDLYATVNHFGSVFFGHYTVYVQTPEDDKWLLYDDDAVRKCKSAEVNNQHAYLLFYRLRS